MARVLLIEDDPAVQRGVSLALKRRGHEVAVAGSGETGLLTLERHRPDLVLLDLMLPNMSGLEVCRRIRESKRIPIIILSARGDEIDMVVGLEAGADDYIVKPAGASCWRRGSERSCAGSRPPRTAQPGSGRRRPRAARGPHGGPHHPGRGQARHRAAPGPLGTEAPAVPHRDPRAGVLAPATAGAGLGTLLLRRVRLVDACVMRLRARIEDDPRKPVYVQTVRGFGYRFGPL